VASVTTRRRVVALTFDDGPSPYTPWLLDELRRLHAPATFFVIGQQAWAHAWSLRRELALGMAVGDYTEAHRALAGRRAAVQRHDIAAVVPALTDRGLPRPQLFRPPYRLYDRTTLGVLRALGMVCVLWSVDPADWRRPGVAAIVRRTLAAVRPGAIVELHDGGGDRSQTVAAVPGIVRALRRRGYRFVTVPRLLALGAPRPPR